MIFLCVQTWCFVFANYDSKTIRLFVLQTIHKVSLNVFKLTCILDWFDLPVYIQSVDIWIITKSWSCKPFSWIAAFLKLGFTLNLTLQPVRILLIIFTLPSEQCQFMWPKVLGPFRTRNSPLKLCSITGHFYTILYEKWAVLNHSPLWKMSSVESLDISSQSRMENVQCWITGHFFTVPYGKCAVLNHWTFLHSPVWKMCSVESLDISSQSRMENVQCWITGHFFTVRMENVQCWITGHFFTVPYGKCAVLNHWTFLHSPIWKMCSVESLDISS